MSSSKLKNKPMVEPNSDSLFAESYRFIQTNIELSSRESTRSILVTSATKEEGKTSTVVNIGIVFAETGKRVLLVDADTRNPQLHNLFSISPSEGLREIVLHQSSLDEVVHATHIPNMYVITGGLNSHNAFNFLSNENLPSVIEEFISKFDLVIFDSPPVLSVSDGLHIAHCVDGVILVVNSKKTNRLSAKQAVSVISSANGNVMGGILNRMARGSRNGFHFASTSAPSSSLV